MKYLKNNYQRTVEEQYVGQKYVGRKSEFVFHPVNVLKKYAPWT